MLYTLIGNGNPNRKEIVASLESLRDAVGESDEFWMLLVAEPDPSPATQSVVSWLNENSIYTEVVSTADEPVHVLYKNASEFFTARRVTERAIALTKGRVQPGEGCALLIMGDDISSDENLMFAIEKAIDSQIPVYDLGGQMVQIQLEEEEPIPSRDVEEPVQPPVVEAEAPAAPEEMEFTRSDLEELTRDELKSLVSSHNVSHLVRDFRSRDALIDALLGVDHRPFTDEESPVVISTDTVPVDNMDRSIKWIFITQIYTDGTAEVRPLTPEQAAHVL